MGRLALLLLSLALSAFALELDVAHSHDSWKARAAERLQAFNYTNTAPLIGILSQPCTNCPGVSYIPAAYVKWVESAGARAVPIRYHESDEKLEALFNSVSGLVLPGGLTWLWLDAPYVITARKLWEMANAANDAGDFFPIHGTCLGHQLLHILTSNVSRNDLLVETDAVQNPNVLHLTDEARNSVYFNDMPPELLDSVTNTDRNIAYENHEYGLPPHHYSKWPVLAEEFNIVSTTRDRNGLEYVSTVEGKKRPYFGTQWHPEKPPYEFSDRNIPHDRDAIQVSQHLAMHFVDIARISSHKMPVDSELELTIYNYPASYTARDDVFEGSYDGPDMVYFLDGDAPEVQAVL